MLFFKRKYDEKTSLNLALLFASAGAKDDKTITIGATPVPFGEILEFAKPLFAKKGYELKIVEFNDFAIPNVALNDGELDANFFSTSLICRRSTTTKARNSWR